MLMPTSWMDNIILEVRVVVSELKTVKGLIKTALAAFAKQGHNIATTSSSSSTDHYALYLSRFSLHGPLRFQLLMSAKNELMQAST
ncbi:hypothetical protein GOP47_0015220 [Adiantum capillus-veneris]|uniref:DUF7054 domain-containing protein n=1 Tax=Adiantum capillus-veneris TaxID=13818 RepID=A0A9D4ZBG1_ADICA|nr:hypothetical protein GOP47_0015220 [Adiantum capillus-veneris]